MNRIVSIVKNLVWSDETQTQSMAQALAQRLQAMQLDACISLVGDLGAGKTTWVRFLLQALGVQGRIKSPTYAVVEPYEVPAGHIWHFDFYRFNDPQEWEDAGFRDIFASHGLKLCEWPQKVQGIMPQPDLIIQIHLQDDMRHVQLQALSTKGEELIA
jgi:tRNA threonylcarbamoyladenosine biosynthesis protein TsaE